MDSIKYFKKNKMIIQNYSFIILGSCLYALSINYFLVPLHLYSGGIPGTAQMLRSLFFSNVTNIDLAGYFNLIFNLPLFLLAYKTMKKRMIIGTLLSVFLQTILFSYVIAPKTPILDDKFSCLLLSGILGGMGCGLILSNGASAGGLDLLGLYFTSKYKNSSVGRFNAAYNVILYSMMALLFNVSTAIYSIFYIIIFAFAIDRFHLQNIEMQLMIFTHQSEIKQMIMHKYKRGVTYWHGMGAYTNNETEVLVTIVAKSEVAEIKHMIQEFDKQAFIITSEISDIRGGYQKRLI